MPSPRAAAVVFPPDPNPAPLDSAPFTNGSLAIVAHAPSSSLADLLGASSACLRALNNAAFGEDDSSCLFKRPTHALRTRARTHSCGW